MYVISLASFVGNGIIALFVYLVLIQVKEL